MSALVLTHFVDRNDSPMVELRGSFGLDSEPPHIFCAGQIPGQDHLYRHHPIQTHLPRLVDDSHPAAADFLQELVVSKVTNSRSLS